MHIVFPEKNADAHGAFAPWTVRFETDDESELKSKAAPDPLKFRPFMPEF
jgi:hypothetical protein